MTPKLWKCQNRKVLSVRAVLLLKTNKIPEKNHFCHMIQNKLFMVQTTDYRKLNKYPSSKMDTNYSFYTIVIYMYIYWVNNFLSTFSAWWQKIFSARRAFFLEICWKIPQSTPKSSSAKICVTAKHGPVFFFLQTWNKLMACEYSQRETI